ncbi:MAG: response regulator [Rhodospirillaceae bacterium]
MPHKLLLADDSVTIQRVIELTFADEDVQVIAVGDGQKAIERIEAERPDIVLADVGMPERDGYEVAAFVKGTAHLAHIPVLLLTGAFEPVDEQRAGAVGCDGVLAKPFEPHMVITRVKELLAGVAGGGPLPRRGPAGVGAPPVAAVPDAGAGAPDADDHGIAEAAAAEASDSARGAAQPEPPEAEAAGAADAQIHLDHRTPIAVPGFGAPPPPVESHAALDEYFDRLDAAFSTLQQAPAPAAEPGPPAGAASPEESGAPPASRAEAAPTPAAKGPSQVPGIAQAFTALFAAERGETPADLPAYIGPSPAPQVSVDDLVERVTRQVLERLSDRVVRETVSDVVSRVAERLVRDEIERVKATLK